ncbi:MAG: hypothetical protein GY937_13550 [bacterium]|nr:hypothetical protein [bacterium]
MARELRELAKAGCVSESDIALAVLEFKADEFSGSLSAAHRVAFVARMLELTDVTVSDWQALYRV